jgi:glycogen debranching enzyme
LAALTILEGATFCTSDERGDVVSDVHGLFVDDTRHLSLLRLTIDGERPLLLSSGRVEYFSAAFYLRNPLLAGLAQDAVSIVRERFVNGGIEEHVHCQNHSMETVEFELRLELASDFADIFTVKEHDFALGRPLEAPPLPPAQVGTCEAGASRLVISDPGSPATTYVFFTRQGEVDAGSIVYRVRLAPRQRWSVRIDVVPSRDGEQAAPRASERRFGEGREHERESLAAWSLRVPRLEASWRTLERSFAGSISDLASLRMRTENGTGRLPAAGMPWFMAVFGRDTLITCLQTLLLGPELAVAALEALAGLQARELDPSIDAEPGKIVHEVRRGKAASRWFRAYYGSVDATPLFLILLSEVCRWTGDYELAHRFRGPAMDALGWIDEWGDRDGDGFVEYERRSARGLANQSWKDSGDSQRFADGRLAEPPIAPCEVQGYVYDAKRRLAELARAAWGDAQLAERLEREAAELKARFHDAFWVESRGGYYALALDRDKRQVDAMCSNMGHLLWNGIVPAERVGAVAETLVGEGLWSGWGVRTMAATELAFNPLSYHNGTVWPHDNSLIAWGLAGCGRWGDAHLIARRLLEAASHFDWQLPEVFAGFPRAETPFPIAYPTASSPQAWAAGTPILLLGILLGLRPDPSRQTLESVAPAPLPSWVGDLRLTGVRAAGAEWNVSVEDGRVRVDRA